ncbi:hypothetical protein Dfri01_33870 [Dyadobacter frigoris]|nr:hypothetical protein Dfri01_33870 [Dyadobacter frigoris]
MTNYTKVKHKWNYKGAFILKTAIFLQNKIGPEIESRADFVFTTYKIFYSSILVPESTLMI